MRYDLLYFQFDIFQLYYYYLLLLFVDNLHYLQFLNLLKM